MTTMKILIATLCFLLGLANVIAQVSFCKQKDVCLVITKCPKLLNIRKTLPQGQESVNFIRSKTCGYEGRTPKVCCTLDERNDKDANSGPEHTNNGTQGYNNNNNYSSTTISPPRNDELHQRAINLLPSDCGKNSVIRIVGGSKTALDEFPWMALLEYNTEMGIQTKCGGVLINKRYVLTAAHCFNPPAEVSGVRLGEYNTETLLDCISLGQNDSQCAPPAISLGIEEALVHENYSLKTQQNDIALVRLSRDILQFTHYIAPICLPEGPHIENNLIAAGWGYTESGMPSNVKLKAMLPHVPRPACAERYKVPLAENQICAGGIEGKDSCKGDSGGPLMQEILPTAVREAKWEVVGVVSFGAKTCGMGGWPGVYTNVSYHMPWILSKIRP